MTYVDDVIAAVRGVTGDWREQESLLFACAAESGCQPIQNRQGAPAYGPWQIFLPYHAGVSVAQANDPSFAAKYMYDNMGVTDCVNQQGNLWQSDSKTAMLNAGRCIEHASPLEQYSNAQKQAGWTMAETNAPANGQPTTPSKPGCSSFLGVSTLPDGSCVWPSASGAGPSSPMDALVNLPTVLANKQTWIRLGLFVLGVVTIIAGLHAFTGVSATV